MEISAENMDQLIGLVWSFGVGIFGRTQARIKIWDSRTVLGAPVVDPLEDPLFLQESVGRQKDELWGKLAFLVDEEHVFGTRHPQGLAFIWIIE